MDEDIFVFHGPEWVMKISIEFFMWRSLARCRAVMKNAFRHYDMNKEELRRLYDYLEKDVESLAKDIVLISKDKMFLKVKEKYEKLITWYDKEVEKHG